MFNPKFKLGEKVVVGDGILTGTISDIIYNSSGFQYMLEEYPDMFDESELTSLEGTKDVVTIDLDDDDSEDKEEGIQRLDIVKARGTDALFIVKKVEGDNAYLINIRHGNEIMFPVSELEIETDEDKVEEAVNPDLIDELREKVGFEIGDLVIVGGYSSIFTIVGHNDDKTVFQVKQYLLEDVTDTMLAFPEDMELATPDEIEEYENQSFIAREFEPVDKTLDFLRTPKVENHTFRNEEKQILAKLEHNRKVIATLKEWQDWFYEMYLFTNDEKYIRRINRVKGWVEKIPTRAYQIK